MNLKGIKVTKKMYKKLEEIGVSNLKASMLQGLEEFKKFTWSNFVKQEFSSLINCIISVNGANDCIIDSCSFNSWYINKFICHCL